MSNENFVITEDISNVYTHKVCDLLKPPTCPNARVNALDGMTDMWCKMGFMTK